VFGLACVDTSLEGAADHLVSCAQAGISRHVAFVNAHCLNQSVGDPALLQALRGADILFADGIGMQLASRLHGHRLNNNVNGTDLFPLLCDRAEIAGVVIGLLGGAPGVGERCKEFLQRRNPNLRIAYVHNGFIEPGADDAVIAAINASGTEMLLVAMGVPRQERWVLDHGKRLKAPVLISVGGLLDFVSGRIPRAPPILRRLRMEWLFRLYVEPRRLFRRYVVGNPIFLVRALRFAVTGRLWAGDKPSVNRGAA
jgi:N-acetylglucosaminyldiphosphoundecaprenol N-acetyl-beta-D-mannosaminyltransferase